MKYTFQRMLLLLAFLLAGSTAYSRVYYVKNGADGDGSSWSNASGAIQEMIDKAQPGNEVWIAKGTYYPTYSDAWEPKPSDFFFQLKDGISLYGGFAGTENSKNDRHKVDRDHNGEIEAWEFCFLPQKHPVIQSGLIHQ